MPCQQVPQEINKLLLGFYFAAWYALNVGYNIYVKKTLNVCPLPFTFAVIQLGAGIVWLAPQVTTLLLLVVMLRDVGDVCSLTFSVAFMALASSGSYARTGTLLVL